MKNHGLSKNGMFLLCSDLYYVRKRGHSCTIRVLFLKERLCFLPSHLITFLLFSLYIYLRSYPNIQLHVPFIIWGIWLSTRTGVKSSFLYFRHFHSYDIICWLEDKDCTNVARGPVGKWLCYYLGNSPWTLRGTSGVLWMIHMFLKWSNMHSTNKGCLHLKKSPSPFLWVLEYHVRCLSYFLPKAVKHGPRIGSFSQRFLFLCSQPFHV